LNLRPIGIVYRKELARLAARLAHDMSMIVVPV